MVLYIEYVLIDNIIMNYIIINLIEKTTKYKLRKLNTVFSIGVGTCLTLFLPYIYNYWVILHVYRLFIALVMVLILKKYKNISQFFKYFILFFLYTFLLGGVIFGLISMMNIDYSMSGILLYSFEFPVSIFVLLVFLSIKLVSKVVRKASSTLCSGKFLYPIKLIDKGVCVDGVGFFDSGNTITVDGDIVNVISIDMFLKLYKEISIDKILLRNIEDVDLKSVKYIKIDGLKSNGKYLSFFIDKMYVGKELFNNVRVAVAHKSFNDFDCILNGKLNVR